MRVPTMYVNRNGTKVKIDKSKFNPAIDKQWRDSPEPEKPKADNSELRAKYEEVVGKKPGPRMSAEKMQAAIEQAEVIDG